MRPLDRRLHALEDAADQARIEFVVIESIAGPPGAEVLSAALAGVRYDRAEGESAGDFKARLAAVAMGQMRAKRGPALVICDQADLDL